MFIPFKSGLAAAAAAAALLCLPATGAYAATDLFSATSTSGANALAQFSTASPIGTTSTAQPQTLGQTQAQVATDFLTQTINQATTPNNTVSPFDISVQVSDDYVQSAAAKRNPLSSNLRGSSDLALWNLVASVRAQQNGNSFDLVDTGLASLQVSALALDPASAVPLPGAAWLFVMGILGLTGTRLTGIKSAAGSVKRAADRPAAAGPFGAAVPA